MAEHLFKDIFEVTKINPDGKKFDKTTRIVATSENEMSMQLDVNTELCPLVEGDKFNMVLVDGSTDSGLYTQVGGKTLYDEYDYIMHGKLYRISESTKDSNGNSSTEVEIYASFGGLLMVLRGDPSSAASFQLDQRLYLLIKKVSKG